MNDEANNDNRGKAFGTIAVVVIEVVVVVILDSFGLVGLVMASIMKIRRSVFSCCFCGNRVYVFVCVDGNLRDE